MKNFRFFLLLAGFSFTACRPPQTSHQREAIDGANSLLRRYGLTEMPVYEELTKAQHLMTHEADGSELLPWTDSYWPTT